MAEQQTVEPTPADVLSVGEKLEAFRQTLPPGEQAVLAWLIQRAAMAPENSALAQGYAIVFSESQESGKLPFRFETTWSVGENQ
jgi:hypothetical protein